MGKGRDKPKREVKKPKKKNPKKAYGQISKKPSASKFCVPALPVKKGALWSSGIDSILPKRIWYWMP